MITDFFNNINSSKINYILIRNISNELPNALQVGKDIDLLVKYNDRKKIVQFLNKNGYRKINHPLKNDLFLYGVNPFEMFNKYDVLIDLNYQLTCRSLNAGEWIPLDRKIQDSAWKNKMIHEYNQLRYFKLGIEDEFVSLISRSIFDKREFQPAYINTINQCLLNIDKENVIEKLELIFFRYTPILFEKIQNNDYNSIIESYLAFKAY